MSVPIGVFETRTLLDLTRGGLFVDGDWVESKDQDPTGSVRLTQLADVGVAEWRDRSDRWLREDQAERLNCTFLEPRDILVARMPDPIGRACLVPAEIGRAVTVVDVAILRPARSDVDRRFLMWAINSRPVTDQVALVQAGATRQRISRKNLGKVQVPFPEVRAQRRIADFLDYETAQIDALIAKQEQLIARLRERRVSVIEHTVWQGTICGCPTAPTRLDTVPTAPAHWARIRNKDLFSERVEGSPDGEGELLTVSHITGVTPRAMKSVNMFEAESLEGYKHVHPGDLAINTMWAWMGALGVSTYDGLVSPAYGVYAPTKRQPYSSRYYDYLYRTRSYVTEMTRNSRGIVSSRLRLYPEVFLRMPVVAPPIKEQNQIVAYLDEQTAKIDSMIAKAEEFIELARERRTALITEAVTGRIDVSTGEVREGV